MGLVLCERPQGVGPAGDRRGFPPPARHRYAAALRCRSAVLILAAANLVQLRRPPVRPVDLTALHALIERTLDAFAGGWIDRASRVRSGVLLYRFCVWPLYVGVGMGAKNTRSGVDRSSGRLASRRGGSRGEASRADAALPMSTQRHCVQSHAAGGVATSFYSEVMETLSTKGVNAPASLKRLPERPGPRFGDDMDAPTG